MALPFALVMVLGAAPGGCEGLDLPAALELARQRSDEVAIKLLERQSAQVDVSLASAIRFIPSANLTVIGGPAPGAHGNVVQSEGGTSNRSLNDLGPFVRVDANIVQPLWTWGQLDAAREAAGAGESARAALVEDMVSQVQLRLARLFWAHALAKRLLTVAETVGKNLDEVDQRLSDALAKNDAAVTPNDPYRVALLRAELARRKADAQKAARLAEIGIAASLAMDTSELTLSDVRLPAEGEPIGELPELLERAEKQRNDLLALSHAIEAQKAALKAAEAAMLPQLFAAGTFSVAYAPNRDLQTNPWVNDPFREVTAGVVLGLRQDLSLHVLDAKAKKASAELATLERQQTGLRRLVRAQVESARAEWVASSERQRASAGGHQSAKAWFRSSELNFGAGVGDGRSLLEAYTGYVESQVVLATTQYELLVAHAALDQATGAPIAARAGACVISTP